MNLTKCFVAGMCLSALTASAVELKANAFETGEAGTGWTFDGVKDWDTAGVRFDGDASLEGYTAARPMTGVTSNKVLKLDTEGSVWTNTVVGGSFLSDGNKVFTDLLVKFVPSEELPVIGSDIKLAVAVVAGTPNKLAISVIDQNTYTGITNVWIVTDGAVDTNTWCRLTIEMGNIGGSTAYANVKTNGVLVNIDPYYVNQTDLTLNAIGFQGTGFIDEVVVRTDDPFGATTVAFGGVGPLVDPLELTAWKLANDITGTEDPDSFNAFVMNVAPELDGTSPVLVVNSIVIDGTTTLTVMAKYADDSLVALGTPLYNGAVLTVWGKVELDDAVWVNLGTDLSDFDQTTYKFFTVTTGETPTL